MWVLYVILGLLGLVFAAVLGTAAEEIYMSVVTDANPFIGHLIYAVVTVPISMGILLRLLKMALDD